MKSKNPHFWTVSSGTEVLYAVLNCAFISASENLSRQIWSQIKLSALRTVELSGDSLCPQMYSAFLQLQERAPWVLSSCDAQRPERL